MSEVSRLKIQVHTASRIIAPYWPIEQFIACNPLLELQDLPFEQALMRVQRSFGAKTTPSRQMGQEALAAGDIHKEQLYAVLKETDGKLCVEQLSCESEPELAQEEASKLSELDALLVKYLGAFLGATKQSWAVPGRELGFYRAWKELAAFDSRLPGRHTVKALPESAGECCLQQMQHIPERERIPYLEQQLAALPGYCGYIKHLEAQSTDPEITLLEYLAVRLSAQALFGTETRTRAPEGHLLKEDLQEGLTWLEAWERSFRQDLFGELTRREPQPTKTSAQWVFCIDARSEAMRRALEELGGHETFGFAGFFAVPMRYQAADAQHAHAAYPALLQGQVHVRELHAGQEGSSLAQIGRAFKQTIAAAKDLAKEPNASLAYIEASGLLHGASLAARTWWPRAWSKAWERLRCALGLRQSKRLTLEHCSITGLGVPLELRCQIAESVLRGMGLTENFAALVILCGHAASTCNNPYAASLHCGACGGNPGAPNARVAAEILNQKEVRAALARKGIAIPQATRFLAAEHDTTTDKVSLLSPEHAWLEEELARAQTRCATMRQEASPAARPACLRAVDWAETRPEWGLARNAAMIIAPRSFTYGCDLDGRAFLHSYDCHSDPEGAILAGIFAGPVVVAHWINMQYYFSTVDNTVFGSGSKVTQNVLGRAGVVQRNGSDLARGLPYQSVFGTDGRAYHQPLRLCLVARASRQTVDLALKQCPNVQQLVDHAWLTLYLADPATDAIEPYLLAQRAAAEQAFALVKR